MRSGVPLTAPVPTDIPASLIAGDTWQWTKYVNDYSAADGWVLKYYLSGPENYTITATTDTDGVGFAVSELAATTATKAAGIWQYIARVELGSAAHTVDSGSVVVLPNLATVSAGSQQSHAEQMVVLLRAEIKARLSGTAGTAHNDYTIDNRQISKIPLNELRGMLKGYELELAAQKNGGRLPPYRVGFSRAS